MDKTAAKRAKWYRKIDRVYEKELQNNPSAANLLRGLAQASNPHEVLSLLPQTTDVGHRMRQIDAKRKWPSDLDVGSVYRKWQQDWGMEAIGALERAISRRDDVTFEEPEFYRLATSQLEAFAGNEARLAGKTNLLHYLGEADPEQTVSFFEYVLTSKTLEE